MFCTVARLSCDLLSRSTLLASGVSVCTHPCPELCHDASLPLSTSIAKWIGWRGTQPLKGSVGIHFLSQWSFTRVVFPSGIQRLAACLPSAAHGLYALSDSSLVFSGSLLMGFQRIVARSCWLFRQQCCLLAFSGWPLSGLSLRCLELRWLIQAKPVDRTCFGVADGAR